ncbi:hypothetical protein M0802_005216 [Mischocyttarus mexicanus]|nr:hypothetical protein M0802_005216 [Mischocyttarus mexicanus]
MPIGIFRPGIVTSTYREPLKGWVDSYNGPVIVYACAGKGFIRSFHCDGSVETCLVPGDLTTNALIVSAWDIANKQRIKEDLPIYNYVSKDNPIIANDMKELVFKYGTLTPCKDAIRYYSLKFNKYRLLHLFYVYLLQLFPAFLCDIITFCRGKKTRYLNFSLKLHANLDKINYFCLKEWKFTNNKWNEVMRKLVPEDRELFYCDMKDLNWDIYFRTYFLGIRLYVLKDPIKTLPQARKKWRRYLLVFHIYLSLN